ncbi:putative G-protein coupled receptor [Apostichopus japonicus]|uniref:Putative G-protein coupled receptor n=1 Tax=Stichopus japonicus TaxID=307972 RepID=A0A2G8L7W3_STIJA|nr:putative G-protein coupled receptor [Apostichopus japonicus]
MNLQQPYGRIIASLELQISHVQKSGTNYSEIKDNVLVEALIFNPSITKGLTLVKLHSNDTDTYNGVNEKRPKHTKTSIYLPQEVFEEAKKDKTNNGTIPISFVIYSNASLFGTNTSMNLFEENLNTKKYSHIISSEVISATVDGGPIENLDPPVILRFFLPENDKACEKRRCAYYVPNGTNSGTWSTDGCSTSMEGNSIVCKCDHLSSFTVLVVRTARRVLYAIKAEPKHISKCLGKYSCYSEFHALRVAIVRQLNKYSLRGYILWGTRTLFLTCTVHWFEPIVATLGDEFRSLIE